MIRRWWLPLALLLSLGVNLGVVAMLALRRDGAPPPEGPGPIERGAPPRRGEGEMEEPGRRFDALARTLRLDDNQAERFVALQRRHFEGSRETRQRLEAARRDLAQEFLTGRADRLRVEALLRQVEAAQAELDQTLADLMLEAQEFLTPEQQRRFAFFVLQRLRNSGQPPPAGGPLRRLLERRGVRR